MSSKRTLSLIGGDFDQFLIDLAPPDDFDLTITSPFYLTHELPDHSVRLSVYGSIGTTNVLGQELFVFTASINIPTRHQLSNNHQPN